MDTIEYDRSVHAEMAAITDAALRGVTIKDCTLYTTTFPCHNCARHIVSAGISRVVYIHPYEKSLTKRLHGDAIGIDLSSSTGHSLVRFDPFVGIAPTLYFPLFTMGDRRGKDERWRTIAKWDKKKTQPRFEIESTLYIRGEEKAAEWLLKKLKAKSLAYTKEPAYDKEGEREESTAPSDG